jgi:hypothetical protein
MVKNLRFLTTLQANNRKLANQNSIDQRDQLVPTFQQASILNKFVVNLVKQQVPLMSRVQREDLQHQRDATTFVDL